MPQAFSTIRVLDFTQVFAGPYATFQLALLGADVVKIEQPGKGDQARRLMTEPRFEELGQSPGFMALNANKRSLTVDLKHERAAEIIHRLAARADVVVENFRAGVIDRLNFGYAALAETNPRLVYCSISGYGQTGPRQGDAAYDGAVQASSGMMSMTGHPGHVPTRAGYTVVDIATGMSAAFAIAAALHRRAVTGAGQYLDLSMLDSALNVMGPQISNYLNGGIVPELLGNRSPTSQPTGDVFKTADGYIQISAILDRQVTLLCDRLGRPDLLDDPRFASVEARIENADAMRDELAVAFARRTTNDWLEVLLAANVASAAIATVPDIVKDPQLRHRTILQTTQSPSGLDGDITLVNAAFKTETDGAAINRPPPSVGQHTDEVLQELDYDQTAIKDFRASGVI